MNFKLYLLFICSLFSFDGLSASIKIGVIDELRPFTYYENQSWKGIDININKKLFTSLNLNYEFIGFPWARLEKELHLGRIDVMSGLYCEFKELEKFNDIEFSIPIYRTEMALFALKTNNMTINTLKDIKGKSVGLIRAFDYGKEFENSENFIKQDSIDDYTLIKKLMKKRVDFVAVEKLTFEAASKKMNLQDEFKHVYTIKENSVCIGLSKLAMVRNGLNVDSINRYLKQLNLDNVNEYNY